MRHGDPKIGRLCSLARETSHRYELIAALDRVIVKSRMAGNALVESWSSQCPDSAIMAYAAEHDYIVVTNDMDFTAILAATQCEKPSVVQIELMT